MASQALFVAAVAGLFMLAAGGGDDAVRLRPSITAAAAVLLQAFSAPEPQEGDEDADAARA
jgi:hypothetical protein